MSTYMTSVSPEFVPAADSRLWFALYTAPNHEKMVERHLSMLGIETFLPLLSVTRRWKNRITVKIDKPLFSSYLFVKICPSETGRVLSVPRAYSIVGKAGLAVPIPDREIESLRTSLQDESVQCCSFVHLGDRARIKSGALEGLEGIVIRSQGQLRLVISVELISRSVSVHVDADTVEKLSETLAR